MGWIRRRWLDRWARGYTRAGVAQSRGPSTIRCPDDAPGGGPGGTGHQVRAFIDLRELDGGSILQLAGTNFMTSDDGGITWSKAFQRKDTNGKIVGGGEGPSLVKLLGKGIGLATSLWESNPSPEAEVESGHVVFWRSPDGGTTWEPPGTFPLPGSALSCSRT